MKKFLKRVESFANRLQMLTHAIGVFHALHILVKLKQYPEALHTLAYKGYQIHFRKSDLQAILEVLGNQEYSFLRSEIDTRDPIVILDVGGHIGTFAIWCLCINPDAHIISLEPDPETFAILKRNANEFRSKGFHWEIMQTAASKQDGDKLRFSTTGPSMSHRVDPEGTIEVEGISLSTLIGLSAIKGKNIHVLKIDVEGEEVNFLTSRPEALEKVCCVAVELHPYLAPVHTLEAMLKTQYTSIATFYGNHSNKPLLVARKKRLLPN